MSSSLKKEWGWVWLSLFLLGSGLEANPTDPVVVAGQALFSERGSVLEIEAAHQAIIDWKTFSIKEGEITRFLQPGANAKVLNRVSGSEITQLMGALQANGRVYLLNPNGILIGKEAVINTQGLFVSTLEVAHEEFLRGDPLHISGGSLEKIENLGWISSGSGAVCLLAHLVENRGTIEGANVTLGGGLEFLVQPEGITTLFIKRESESSVLNEGTLKGLIVDLQSDGLHSLAVNHKGTIQANRLSKEGGKVFLRAPQGKTSVSGEIVAAGGAVQILGEMVELIDHPVVDVSHEEGAGSILIGGDFQGKNRDVPTAQIVWAGPDSELKADGGGGKVILWGDQATIHYGRITARGGSLLGDGGFVEISAPYLAALGRVDTRGTFGKSGTLLLDPTDVVIGSTMSTNPIPFIGCNPSMYDFITGTQPNEILNTDLENQLSLCNVEINTAASGGMGSGNITLSSPLSWNSNNSLTLIASGSININEDITTVDGNLICTSVGGIQFGGGPRTIQMGNAAMSFDCGGVLSFLSALNLVTTGQGSMNFTGEDTFLVQNALSCNGVDVTVNAGGIVSIAANVSTGSGDLSVSGGGVVNIQTMFIPVSFQTGTGQISISSDSSMQIVSEVDCFSTGGGPIRFHGGTEIVLTGEVNTTAGGSADAFFIADRSLIITENVSTGNGNLSFQAGSDLSIPLAISIDATGNGTINFEAAQDLTIYSRLTFNGSASTSTSFVAARDIFVEAPLSITNLDTSFRAGHNLSLTSSGAFLSFSERDLGLGVSAAIAATNSDLRFAANQDVIVSKVTSFEIPTGSLNISANNGKDQPLSGTIGIINISEEATISGSFTIGNLGFYAAAPGINTFPQVINGAPLSSGNVVCNVIYPEGTSGLPFTIFYQLCPGVVIFPLEQFGAALASILEVNVQQLPSCESKRRGEICGRKMAPRNRAARVEMKK